MKKIYPLFFFLIISVSSFSQTGTVADSLVRDSVPILLTDTTSYNSHARMMIYGGINGNSGFVEEDSLTKYLLFYDKKPDTASFSSIWFRELKNMTPETVFLESNDSIQVSNPQATNAGVVFYEELHDSTITIKGLLIDPLTMTGLDTVSVVTVPEPVKIVANSDYILWIKDSILFRQSFTVNSGTITLGTTDTLTTHATDVCVADYIPTPPINFLGEFVFLTYEDSQSYLCGGVDSGSISEIHFNYTPYLYYKKNGTVFQRPGVYNTPEAAVVLYNNDTIVPEHAVGFMECMNSFLMAFVPNIFPNVFNYCYLGHTYPPYYLASDTFIFPGANSLILGGGNYTLYSYPFSIGDSINNLSMFSGFVIDPDVPGACVASNEMIIIEVQHNNANLLYLVRGAITDCFENINNIKDNPFSLQVFPNPVQKAININYQSETNEPVILSLTDITGKTIDEIQIKSVTGENYYCWEKPELASGVYLLTISQGNKKQTIKLIK